MKKVGILEKNIIEKLDLNLEENSEIFLGDSNINHMKESHPEDFLKYGNYLEEILATPDYIGKNPKDESIEYIKIFLIGEQEYVKVAVRVSNSNKLFARSLYVLNNKRVENFIEKGTLIKVKIE
ncbi:MAG: PBECR2 nuclease fold domain-containing protein [Fusobacteriaceae bacterium]